VTICTEDSARQIADKLAEKLGRGRFEVWFKHATQFNVTGDYLQIRAPNHFIGDYIERNFASPLLEAAREVTGQELQLNFAIEPDLAKGLTRRQPDRQSEFIASQPNRSARLFRRVGGSMANTPLKHRLDDFVVGSSNRLAHAAACNVVDRPGGHYNPLFVHGGCGLGKTHLLQGISNALATRHPQLRWRYVSGEEFTNDFVAAVRAREMDAFHDRYRNMDVLVIDDVHFLANKRATQEGFLHTFKAMDAAGRQVVLASDAHPKVIGQFSDSLISRFLSGMVVRIDAPDLEVRTEVLRRRAERMKAAIPDSALRCIAENFRANIRELEGMLLKVIALSQVSGEPITLPLVERAVKDTSRLTGPAVMLSDIESVVAIHFGLTPADLHTSRKSRTIALARGIAMYLARRHTDMSFPEIGRFMGNKNHSTVILACRRISRMLQSDATVDWLTPEGLKHRNLAVLMTDFEEQFGGAGQGNEKASKNGRAHGRAIVTDEKRL